VLVAEQGHFRIPRKYDCAVGPVGVPPRPRPRLASLMQRLFSMFPAGAPGLALLVLRLVTIAWLHLDATAQFAFSPHVPALISLEVLSVALLVGALTPYVACAAGLVKAIDLIVDTTFPGVLGGIAFAHFVILLLLGPGAYSVDARLFGRRVTVLTSPR
jgi:hypothetical protein